MAFEDPAEDIRRRMAELRRELSSDVREVGRNARVMADWRFYVRRFPWAVAGVAVAAGYLLIPQRKEVKVISPDANALAEMFKKEQLKVQTPAGKKQDSPGLLKGLLLTGLTLAARTGMNYVGERVRTAAVNKAHQPPRPADETAPRAQPWPK